jgi:hypothetical protein
VYTRFSDGLYRIRPADKPLSYPAVLDMIDRFHHRWRVLRPGLAYRQVGDRILVLWHNRDGTYRCGYVSALGERKGHWIVERGTVTQARNAGELWRRDQPRQAAPPLSLAQILHRIEGGRDPLT